SLGYGFSSRVGGLAFGPYHHLVLWMLPTVGFFYAVRVVLVCSSPVVGCGWLFFQFRLVGPRPPTKQALGHLLRLCRFLGCRFWRVSVVLLLLVIFSTSIIRSTSINETGTRPPPEVVPVPRLAFLACSSCVR